MIARLITLLLLIAVLAGGLWFFFRDTSARRVARWRKASQVYFEQGDLDLSEDFNRRILAEVPDSVPDRLFRAQITEQKATPESLVESIEIYDRILKEFGTRAIGVQLFRARTLRLLGRFNEARGIALSLMDLYPFAASMQLGLLALDRLDHKEALSKFSQARFHAPNDTTRLLQTFAAEALVFKRLLEMAEARTSTPTEESSSLLMRWKADYAAVLEQAWELIGKRLEGRSLEKSSSWVTSICSQRSAIRSPKKTPYYEGAMLLRASAENSNNANLSPDVRRQIGSLLLRAAWFERSDFADHSDRYIRENLIKPARASLKRALSGLSAADARKFLFPRPWKPSDDDKTLPDKLQRLTKSYIVNLIGIAKLHLQSPEFGMILDDASELELSRRIQDVIAHDDPDTSGLFRVLRGLAMLKDGQSKEAGLIFDGYLKEAGAWESRATLEIVEEILELAPGNALVLEYEQRLGTFKNSALTQLGRRARLLLRMQKFPSIASEAEKRLTKLIQEAKISAKRNSEIYQVTKVLLWRQASEQATQYLRDSVDARPEAASLRHMLVEQLIFEARKLDNLGGAAEDKKTEYLAEALGHSLRLFIAAPMASASVASRCLELLEYCQKKLPGDNFGLLVSVAVGGVDKNLRKQLIVSIESFLRGLYPRVLENADFPSTGQLQEFLVYARGVAHLELATVALESQLEADAQRHLEAAEGLFSQDSQDSRSKPVRLEMARLELRRTSPNENVSNELLKSIADLAEGTDLTEGSTLAHHADMLLSNALYHRFEFLLETGADPGSMPPLVLAIQAALRRAIRRSPTSIEPYTKLAESYLLESRIRGSRQPGKRDFERAIKVLRSVPDPGRTVIDQLSVYLELADHPVEARAYLSTLFVIDPKLEYFERLVDSYIEAEESGEVLKLLGEEEFSPPREEDGKQFLSVLKNFADVASDQPVGGLVLTLDLILFSDGNLEKKAALRHYIVTESRKLEGFQISRHRLLAKHYARGVAPSEPGSRSRRANAIRHYRLAVEAYEAEGQSPPLNILNNLSWYLLETGEARNIEEGLSRIKQAVERAGDKSQHPSIHDTHGYALYKSGNLKEARAVYEELLETKKHMGFSYRLALILYDLAEYDLALKSVQISLNGLDRFPQEKEAKDLEQRILAAIKERAAALAPPTKKPASTQ